MSYLISKNQKDIIDYFKNYFDLTAINNINYFIKIQEYKIFLINLNGNKDKDIDNKKKFTFPHTNLEFKYFLKKQQCINNFSELVNKDIYDL